MIDKCTCLKNVYILSHAWGYQSWIGTYHDGGVYSDGVGGGPNDSGFYGKRSSTDHADARSVNDLKNEITAGNIKFCKACNITLTGCRVSSTGSFAKSLAQVTGCEIIAASGASSGKDEPDFVSGPKTWDERIAEGALPWQKLIPAETVNPVTGETETTVTTENIGNTLNLW